MARKERAWGRRCDGAVTQTIRVGLLGWGSAEGPLGITRPGTLGSVPVRLENTHFVAHSMGCMKPLLAELICVELKEIGRAILPLNKCIHSLVFLIHINTPGVQKKSYVLPVLRVGVPHTVECTQLSLKGHRVLGSGACRELAVPTVQ